jgi:hypothetical protein
MEKITSFSVILFFIVSVYSTALSAQVEKRSVEPFQWARLKFKLTVQANDHWDVHPWADEFLLDMLEKYTSLNVDKNWHVVSLNKLDEMMKFPLIFMTTENKFSFTKKQQANFKEYIERGGFIYADDCVYDVYGDFFFKDLKNKVEKLFNKKMVRLPDDHEIYNCFYKLKKLPYMQGVDHGGWALFLNGRMAVFLTPTDIHCGWASCRNIVKNGSGWFSKKKSYDAIKMGINIIVYAMTH